ncbi:DUF1127 domain-containing protein [Marivita sp. S2033]|uniref:DUF1127 domain-containing protein n=1 Tax=Marivita sp. S2033 TaxID=3373187 RepID=UPI003982CAD5
MHPFLSHRNYFRNPAAITGGSSDYMPAQAGFLRRWTRSSFRNWKRRKMIAALQGMNDHMLRDIGINRHEITQIVDSFDDRELRMRPVAETAAPAPTIGLAA